MLTSLSLIFLVGLAMAAISQKLKLPRLIGMLLSGIVLGPYVLDFLDPSILGISSELRQMALVIILIRAGLSLNLSDLKQVGRPAILMSFLPALFELSAYIILAPALLGVNRLEAAMMGSVLAAVSPAVVVPMMVRLMEEGYGTKKRVPQLILAGATLDDVFVIVLFTTFVRIARGDAVSAWAFVNVPIAIAVGVVIGAIVGWMLALFFEAAYARGHLVRNSMKVMIILGFAFLLLAVETWLVNILPISGLLAVMSMASVLQLRSTKEVVSRLAKKFSKLWLAAEILLFVLVGAAVDIRYTLSAGLSALAMIALALTFRSLGVLLCLLRTPLNSKERLFTVLAYLPKATVQAAIGSIPLALGLPSGKIILSVAVLGILITAPLGALGMEMSYRSLLVKE